MTDGGVFAVHRGVFKHEMFADEPYTEREAWLWLIGNAAWKKTRVRVKDSFIPLERGQLAYSLRFLATHWKWSKNRVARFLDILKNEDMIGTQPGHDTTIITVCKYDDYQLQPGHKRDADGTQNGTPAGRQRDTSGTNKNKDNNCNKDDDDARATITPKANRISDEIAAACGHDPAFVPPSWMGAPYRAQQWLNQGWPEEIILLSVREQIAKKRDGPPSRIEYFEKGIASAIARQNAPLPTAEQTGRQNGNAKAGSGLAAIDRIFDQLESRSSVPSLSNENAVLSLPPRPISRS